jgi:hypothetical protein
MSDENHVPASRSPAAEPRAQASPETADRAVLKLTEEAAVGCDCHEGIPRDGDGIPTYFILPPVDRAYYEERLASFERAWNATKDPAYYRQANTWVGCFRQPHPPWLIQAGDVLAAKKRTPKHDEDYADAQRHFRRHEIVRDLVAAGWKEEAAFAEASARLKKMGIRGSASRTIEDSYRKVLREFKAGRNGRYKPLAHERFRAINRG